MQNKERKERDNYIVLDYAAGLDSKSIARSNGISSRRVMQILKERGVDIRPRKQRFEIEPVSRMHERIGRVLIDYRFDAELDQLETANELGWSLHKLKKAEAGISELELLDLLDICALTRRKLTELLQ